MLNISKIKFYKKIDKNSKKNKILHEKFYMENILIDHSFLVF